MSKGLIIIYSVSVGFFFSDVIRTIKIGGRYRFNINLFNRKPFTCVQCMSGWTSLKLSLIAGYGLESIPMTFLGLFAGAVFESIKMRYL